ncbi:MAG: transporter substrate-binding domain-containing protein [Hyphomicrobiales bacterium]|nr:transporter substrate-binding domain-containing protein [Hyphomicrobiales bacterium]
MVFARFSQIFAIMLTVFVLFLPGKQAMAQTTDLQEIRDRGVVRVGAVHAPPYYIKDPATNEWSGLVPDIAKLIFASINVEVEYVETQWGTAVAGLQANQFDIIGAYNATPERAVAIAFTRPIGFLYTGVVILDGDDSAWSTWEAINAANVRIAGVDGAATTRAAERILTDTDWVRTQSNDAMLLELESRRADAILSNHPTLLGYVRTRGRGTMILPEPRLEQPTGFGLRKANPSDLRDWLNVAIAYFEANGELEAVWQKYLPTGN